MILLCRSGLSLQIGMQIYKVSSLHGCALGLKDGTVKKTINRRWDYCYF